MNIIIAPHADDELIGCFTRILANEIHKVVYVETTEERMAEANNFCDAFNLRRWFLNGDIWNLLSLPLDYIYYVPSPEDSHPLHRLIYYLMFHEYSHLVVYSTQMRDYFVREVERPEYKRSLLDKYYPSQKSLWETDHRYFLFEGYAEL